MNKIAVFFFLGLVVQTSAIVVQDYSAAEAAPSSSGYDLDWGYVYNYKESSAVAVGGGWLLTAKHVADDPGTGALSVDGTDYLQQQIVYHPTADLALVRFDKAFPGSYDLYSGYIPASLTDPKLSVLMVGYGATGVVSTASWESAPGWSYGGKGVKRWGSQKIDDSSVVGSHFSLYFNLSNTTYEAGVGTGDSGGGVFYKEGATWKLAGIMTSVHADIYGYDYLNAMSMPFYADWVAETIPEPAAVGLIGFGSIGLFLARARRQRNLSGRTLLPIRHDEHLCDRFYEVKIEEATLREKLTESLVCLLKRRPHSRITLLSTSMEKIPSCMGRRIRFLRNLMVRVYSAVSHRMIAIKSAVTRIGTRGIDCMLDKISCGKMVRPMNARRSHPVKRSMVKGLDLFLDKICFDKVMLMNQQLQKYIRSAIKKAFMDYSIKDR